MRSLAGWLRRERATATPLEALVRAELRDVQAYAASHGGSIQLVSVNDEGIVRVRLRGACATCPLAPLTLRNGVERRLLQIPGVVRVETV